MKKLFLYSILLFSLSFSAQTDYSDSWEDFYSYNNVKDFIRVNNVIYALVDNAVFTFNIATKEVQKLSSIHGLSGETTASIHYSASFQRLIIGYENGLIEIVDADGSITVSPSIVNFSQSGEKRINHIKEFNDKLYLSTPFGIVVYDIERLEFGDTYFIRNNSSSLEVYQTEIFNGIIYAATETGIFDAAITNNLLIDFNSWNEQFSGRNFNQITLFNKQLYVTQGSVLYRLNGSNLTSIESFSEPILTIKSSSSHLAITLNTSAIVLNSEMDKVFEFSPNTSLNTSFFENNTIFLGTKLLGILNKSSSAISFTEIHPKGPSSNDAFSITASNNHLWIVYGGYSSAYVPLGNRKVFSHFDGKNWIPFNSTLPNDLVDVAVDPNNENRVFISSFAQTSSGNLLFGGGLLEVENNKVTNFYHSENSALEDFFPSNPNSITTRISGSSFDSQGNLWVADALASKKLKKLSPNGIWESYDLSSLQTNTAQGTNKVFVDKNDTVWISTRRNGVYAYNEEGNRKKALIATPNSGNLPDLNVRTVAVDKDDRVWIGTKSGLVLYNNASDVFDDRTPNANAVVINGNEEGFGERLLGDQTINSIVVDGAENKWFGTENGGAIYTNPNGQKTLANFSLRNSPLPSNTILKIAVDDSSGKVYFATNKGVVAYNSRVVSFGDALGSVYAYPNPVLKNHKTVTIDGRKGTHLPEGTNVKILDIAGNLVYEANVKEGQESLGGNISWNKRNLAGNKVASGIYIVLLSNNNAKETAVTKIAIVN